MNLSGHFSIEEFFSKDTLADLKHRNINPQWLIARELIERLELIRAHFNAPLKITSGYRSPAQNYLAKGKDYSFHLFGRACDFVVEGIPNEAVQAYCKSVFDSGGLGSSKDFTHLDVRWSKFLVEWEYPV